MNKWYPLRYVSTLVWIGFLLGISFLEAPLKFQAPSVTLSIGLEIGQLVFGALNKVEWILFSMIILSFTLTQVTKEAIIIIVIVAAVLLIQSFYLLPVLDDRATQVIAGTKLPESPMHVYYVALEVFKLTMLILASVHFISATSDEVK